MELSYQDDIVARDVELPSKAHGYCDLDPDGRGNIYTNKKDPPERQVKAVRHELLHYINDDHYRDREEAEEIEKAIVDELETYMK